MYDFTKVDDLNKDLKSTLVNNFNCIYIEKKEIKKEDNKSSQNSDSSLFKIEKNKPSIFSKITSIDTLNSTKKEIKELYENFNKSFLDYFDRVEDRLDEKNLKSFEIIEKTIQNRKKKFSSTIDKFEVEEQWNTKKIADEFYHKIDKNLKDIIETLTSSISTGIKENSAYDGVLLELNMFLKNLGIYTQTIEVNNKCNYDLLEPQPCEECDTTDESKKDIIKEVISYPYMLDENRVLVEGKVILWKVIHNG